MVAENARISPKWRDLNKWRDLKERIASGVVLVVFGGGLLWLGGVWSAIMIAIAAGTMAWEYRAIVTASQSGFQRQDLYFPIIVSAAPLMTHIDGRITPALALIGGSCIAAASMDRGGGRDWRWSAPGLLFLGIASSAFVLLRDQPQFGFEVVVWLVLVVVATDIGGYFAGRLFGGPKLAPTISPKKTWAGLAGGAALASLAGGLFSWATIGTYAEEVATVSLIAALVAQAGDLAESGLKRRFNVKDSSALIPGHGGVLDRLDGLLAATLVAAAFTFIRGKEVFVW
jgi:phosphatidate cytidylyltransferase